MLGILSGKDFVEIRNHIGNHVSPLVHGAAGCIAVSGLYRLKFFQDLVFFYQIGDRLDRSVNAGIVDKIVSIRAFS